MVGPAPGVVTAVPARGKSPAAGTGDSRYRHRASLVCLATAYLGAQVGYAAAGLRFDLSPLGRRYASTLWQLADVRLLREHLVQTVWYLHSQPPLFNLGVGLLLKLPGGARAPVADGIGIAMGAALVVTAYFLGVELGLPAWVSAILVTVLVVASPEYALFQSWLDYSYPTALLVTGSALSLRRYLTTASVRSGLAFFSCCSALVLIDSTFQWPWLLIAAGVAAWRLRSRWRRVAAVASAPLLAVGIWYGKDAVVFGTSTTSSWLGMNLAKVVFTTSPPALVDRAVRSGVVGPLASIPPFSPPASYIPHFAPAPHTGVPVLDRSLKTNHAINFNSLVYVSVSEKYLHDDLAFIADQPGRYASAVLDGVQIWTVPGDQYFPPAGHRSALSGYSDAYDRWVLVQPRSNPAVPYFPLIRHRAPPLSTLSLGLMAVFALALAGAPWVAWRRRAAAPSESWTLAYGWFTVAYVFAVTSLLEIAENERYRFELGPLPYVMAAAVIAEIARRRRTPTAARGRS